MVAYAFRPDSPSKYCDFCGEKGTKTAGSDLDNNRDICEKCVVGMVNLFNSGVLSTIKNNFMNIGAMAKLLLDKDTKTLVKAGFMNPDLTLTQEGKTALDAINFLANKAELVKQAHEVIIENEEKK